MVLLGVLYGRKYHDNVNRGQHTFPVKDQKVNILGFAGQEAKLKILCWKLCNPLTCNCSEI